MAQNDSSRPSMPGAALLAAAPGVAAAAAVMAVALPLADHLGRALLARQGIDPAGAASPVSAVSVAILLGIFVRNVVGVPDAFMPGIRFATRTLLRIGIVFVGIKLSLADVARLGLWGLPIVAASAAAGLASILWLTRRLGLSTSLGALLAAGTSICGVTAIVSVAPAVDADERETAYAVAAVALFGLLGMLVYPYVAAALFAASEQAGLWLGVAIHDTSQVVGAALTYREMFGDDVAFQTAAVAKLTRNLLLVAVVPLLSLYAARQRAAGERRKGVHGGSKALPGKPVPGFVIGFVAMAVLRTVGDHLVGIGDAPLAGWIMPQRWEAVVHGVGDVWGAGYLLGTAMAAVGLGTHFSVFRGVGARPFVVGFVGALLVGVVGWLLVASFGTWVRLG